MVPMASGLVGLVRLCRPAYAIVHVRNNTQSWSSYIRFRVLFMSKSYSITRCVCVCACVVIVFTVHPFRAIPLCSHSLYTFAMCDYPLLSFSVFVLLVFSFVSIRSHTRSVSLFLYRATRSQFTHIPITIHLTICWQLKRTSSLVYYSFHTFRSVFLALHPQRWCWAHTDTHTANILSENFQIERSVDDMNATDWW